MNATNCSFCGKHLYPLEDEQQRNEAHVHTCAIISKIQSWGDEHPPSNKELFKLIQYALYENKKLCEELRHLKSNKRRHRQPRYTFQTHIPPTTFTNWIKEFQVEYRHLEKLFQRNVYDGIKLCITERIQDETWKNIPIHVHQEPRHKRAQIYIYDLTIHPETAQPTNQWILCDNRYLNTMMNAVLLKLEIRFLEWDAQHVATTQEEKEQYNTNLLKIEGGEFRRHIDQYRMDLKHTLIRNSITHHDAADPLQILLGRT